MKRSLHAMIFLMAPVLAACAQPPLPQDHFYRLTVGAPGNPLAEPRFKGTLEVGRFAADGLTAGRPLVHSLSERLYELQEYHYHFWTQPPTVMLRDELVSYLRAAKVSGAVVTPEMRVSVDYVLTGKIMRLERIVGKPSKAVIELELGLRKATGGKLIFLDTYRIEKQSDGSGVGSAVNSLNTALTAIYAKFVDDLSKL